MNKKLLIYALLSMGQLISASSNGMTSVEVDVSTPDPKPGHMHHQAPKSVVPSAEDRDSVVSSAASPISAVYKREELTGALLDAATKAISLQVKKGWTLSDALTGEKYTNVEGFFVGPIVRLAEGDLTRIASAFPKLTALGVSGTGLSALSSEELITELPKLIYLQELNITGKNITDEVIEALVPLAGTLQVLHINYATLTARGVEALKRFSNLTYLNTVGTRIEKSEIADIKTAIPALAAEGAFEKSMFFSFPGKK